MLSDSPEIDFLRKDKQETTWIKSRPVCIHCGNPIQEDRLWAVYGQLYHEKCAREEFEADTEDFIL